jgi:hypothetical protein
MKRVVCFKCEETLLKVLEERASRERRTVSNLIKKTLMEAFSQDKHMTLETSWGKVKFDKE